MGAAHRVRARQAPPQLQMAVRRLRWEKKPHASLALMRCFDRAWLKQRGTQDLMFF